MEKVKKSKKSKLLLGGHMSIAGGFDKAILRGEEINCTAIQIFTASNRQWGAKKILQEEADAFQKTWKKSCVQEVVAHCTYLINIGSPEKVTYKKSKFALSCELQRCQQLEIPYLVLHPGSHLGSGESVCVKQIACVLAEVLEAHPGKSKILIELMAGQGTTVGYKFEQVASMIDQTGKQKNRLGVCLDTCHVFAAGYDFRKERDYENMVHEFDKIIGLKKLKVMHINDSKKDLGTRVDRHEDVGKGKIGLDAFRHIFNDERFFDVPKILETPEGTLANYAMNMKVILGLLTPKTRKALDLVDFE